MEAARFDRLTRQVGGSASRRSLVRTLSIGSVALALALPTRAEAKDCGKNKKRCGNKCCSKGEACKKGKCQKKCPAGQQLCGKRCRNKCPRSSSSVCCNDAFPYCCPRGTFTNRLCCSNEFPNCCPPSPAVPEFPEGYCCGVGFVCSGLGDGCDEIAGLTAAGPRGPVAPGGGGR